MSSTQDVRFSEEKIAMGRGFANKLWNASRLVLLASEGTTRRAATPTRSIAGSRVASSDCLAEVEAAVTGYDFAAAVDTLYHFVWNEFCDWYLELAKVRLYGDDEAAKAAAAGHARWLLGQMVRLLHPFLPFVTEEIAAQYGEAPLIDQAHPLHDAALSAPDDEATVGALQAAVNALRQFRAETKVPPGQVLNAVFVGDGEAAADYAPYVRALRVLARTDVELRGVPEAGATVVLVPGGHLEVAASVDRPAEIGASRAAARQG